MIIQHSEDYQKLRAKEYPKVGDQIDAILKLAIALKDQGINLPLSTLLWIDDCVAVKDKYKKS